MSEIKRERYIATIVGYELGLDPSMDMGTRMMELRGYELAKLHAMAAGIEVANRIWDEGQK